VHGNALAIATHGRGFYLIDDLTPVREWNAAVANEPVHLFTPPVAYRMIPRTEEGTPLPLDVPQLENPADGATIAYRLAADATSVRLEIVDARGVVVRQWSSSDTVTPFDPAKLDIPAYWLATPARLGTTAGVHRWTWDLRAATTLPPVLDEDGEPIGGPWIVPGAYRVRLTVDGHMNTRALTVALDPRIHVSAAALAQQYTFTRQIEALRRTVLSHGKAGAALEARLQRLTAVVQSAPAAPSADALRDYAHIKATATKL
jgi:hypothetical protein